MRRRSLAALLTSAVATGALALAPIQASAADGVSTAPTYQTVIEKYSVKTRHGYIYAEVARPTDGDKLVKGPAVLTYSPYSVLGRSANRTLVSEGYVAVYADVVGTGNSGGCYDYGGKREKQTGYDLVEWIAKQKWSTGKVAMTGGSYNGTTAIATAVTNPPHLTTIIPEAAISRWYEYAYSGGIRYFLNNEKPADEGFDTPLAFDFGFAVPPPLDPDHGKPGAPDPNENYADQVLTSTTPCEEVEHTQHGYDDTPDYDKFWLERDYIKGPDNVSDIDIPVLIAHNWGDWNVKQEEAINLYRALRARSDSPKVSLYMGNRYLGHGVPGGDYSVTKKAWLDHYLMGKDTGIQKLADVTSEMADYDGATDWYSGKWPSTKGVKLYAQNQPVVDLTDYAWKLLPSKPNYNDIFGPPPVSRFPSTNVNTESHANHHGRSNHDWFWFESPLFKKDTRIFGNIKVHLYSKIAREWVTLTPTIVDVDPDCHEFVANQHVAKAECEPRALQSMTRGWLDTRYRKGLSKQVMLDPTKPFEVTVVQKPMDYTFKKGNYIALNMQTEINDWSVPKIYPGCDGVDPAAAHNQSCVNFHTLWKEGKTWIELPVVGSSDPSVIFKVGPHGHDS